MINPETYKPFQWLKHLKSLLKIRKDTNKNNK